MGATAKDTTGRALALAFACAALLGSALAVVVVRQDVLTGTAPAVAAAPDRCDVPDVAPDLSPVIPGNPQSAIFGLLPMLPLPNLGPVAPLDFNKYLTPGQYAEFSVPLLRGSTKSALEESGFVQADTIGYESGQVFFGAEAIQAGSPAQAATLAHTLLANACRAGVATAFRPLNGIPGGVAFVYHDWDFPPYRATFLVGDTLVRLNVCICEENRGDPYAVLDGWASAVHARMRAPLG